MTVDDSFNFHSLSLTIMFAFKRFMIVDDSWQNKAMRSRNCNQIRQALQSAILVALEIFAKKLRVHVNVIIQLHKEEYKWRAHTVKVFCDIVRLFEQLVILYCKNLFNPPSMSNTTAWYKLSNVFTSRPIYSRVVWLVRVVRPVPLTRETNSFSPHTTDYLMKSFTFKLLRRSLLLTRRTSLNGWWF